MSQMLAFLIFVAALAVGEIVSSLTRARVPSLLVAMVIFLIGFWVGLPKNLVETSGLLALAGLATPMIVTHMGTLMSLKQVAQQWKSFVIGIGALVGVGVLLLTILNAIYGMPIAVAAACPISGGIVAALIGMDTMKAIGQPQLQVLVALFLVLQGLIGMPLASNLLKKDVQKNWDKIMSKKGEIAEKESKPEKKLIPPLPEKFRNPFVMLAKVALLGWLATLVAGLTHNAVNSSVVAIVFGLIAYYFGFLEDDVLTKTGTFNFFMLILLGSVMGSMGQATPQLILSFIGPIILGFALGTVGMAVMSWLVGKLVGISAGMAIAVGSTCLYGFPGNYLVVQEVARAMSKDEDERKAILNYILPPMIVGGYATVTIGSVIFAGVVVRFL
ncbi:MAG TPA: hypothetical protein PLT87_07105 [Spirochaetales bacterium]|nr:hypothetical protein [Spirochaetales bacterium]